MKYINSKSNLIQFFSTIEKEIKKNSVYNTENFDNFNWNETITDAEKKLFDYLKKNESDNNLILLKKCLENDNNSDKVFQFYFLDGMKSFLSLNEEDKYVIVNSYNKKEELSLHIMNYIELKNSYDKGMKKENTLKETIKNIIEDEQFFNDLKNIFTSEKVADYCKNPLQYYKGLSGIDIYDEKEKEKEKNLNQLSGDKTISKFNYTNEQNKQEEKNMIDIDTEGIPDFYSALLDDELKENNEVEYKCQLYLDYEYFINKVFNKDFLKERIIYSYLPYGIKACVSLIPKIVINMCGNNIKSYNIETNDSENYKKILRGLYTVIILHELIHLIRRDNPKKLWSKEYTPKADKGTYEGGKSFIYHIFGDLTIIYMDLEFAEVILNKDSWKKNCNDLKNQYSRFKDKKDDEIIQSLKEKELIKCYDSIIEQKDEDVEDYDFCYRFTS